ncbi:MAG: GNAT family N-acetyltransferase [Pseudomonadota bacterium]
MSISIRPVDASNWREIIALAPKQSQQAFIEPNAVSMLESFYDKKLKWKCYGLYEHDNAVGFMMIGARNLWLRDIWLDRFMLDASFQGLGNSHRFLSASIQFIKNNFYVKKINASVIPGNSMGKRFLENQGFIDTGRHDPEFGEQLYILKL